MLSLSSAAKAYASALLVALLGALYPLLQGEGVITVRSVLVAVVGAVLTFATTYSVSNSTTS